MKMLNRLTITDKPIIPFSPNSLLLLSLLKLGFIFMVKSALSFYCDKRFADGW